ncbi:MAG TPA: hypothetical protein VFD73_01960, partial [Gemmatimonadales bacterium]|nr:hypothetical protein [Gemmatimonadales bacterium]
MKHLKVRIRRLPSDRSQSPSRPVIVELIEMPTGMSLAPSYSVRRVFFSAEPSKPGGKSGTEDSVGRISIEYIRIIRSGG